LCNFINGRINEKIIMWAVDVEPRPGGSWHQVRIINDDLIIAWGGGNVND